MEDDDQTRKSPIQVPAAGGVPPIQVPDLAGKRRGGGEGFSDFRLGRNRDSEIPSASRFGRDRESRSRDRESGSGRHAGDSKFPQAGLCSLIDKNAFQKKHSLSGCSRGYT
jgi:hypothetical protein